MINLNHIPFGRQDARRRSGFTLIEILVVIGIIGVLVAVTAVAVSKVISGQRASNTRTAMATIKKVLDTQKTFVIDEARKETGLDDIFASMNQIQFFGADNSGGERNRIIWIKARLMEAFPVSFAEIATPVFIIPKDKRRYNDSYKAAILGAVASKKTNPLTESAACLLIALSIPRGGVALDADKLGSLNVRDTDGDGLKELVDGWGNPLSFFRFPTNSDALQASYSGTPTPKGLFADPIDPTGIFLTWPAGPGRNVFEARIHKIAFKNNPAVAAYVVPTLVSWGPDGDISAVPPKGLGLDANMGVLPGAAGAQEADNIYSFQLR